MTELIAQQFINGLSAGLAYALIALGLTLVFGVLHVINFSHGEFYMLGGLTTIIFVNTLGLPYLLCLILVPLVLALVGLAVNSVAIAPLIKRKDGESDVVLSTYAVSLLIMDILLATRGPAPESIIGMEGAFDLGGVVVSYQRVFILAISVVLIVLLNLSIRRTRFGKQMRAMAQNRFAADVVGIDTRSVAAKTFLLGAGLAGAAGVLLVPIVQYTPGMGQNAIIKAFVVVVMGGMGSVPGAVAAGVLLGVVEAMLTLYLSEGYTSALIYALLLVTLLIRPQGIWRSAK